MRARSSRQAPPTDGAADSDSPLRVGPGPGLLPAGYGGGGGGRGGGRHRGGEARDSEEEAAVRPGRAAAALSDMGRGGLSGGDLERDLTVGPGGGQQSPSTATAEVASEPGGGGSVGGASESEARPLAGDCDGGEGEGGDDESEGGRLLPR
jgi:hypothetical protein